MQSTIPTNYIAVLLETIKPYSISAEQLLGGSGIQLNTLDDYFHQTDLRAFIALVDKAIKLTNDPALGLQFGRCISLSSHGMLGVAASNQSTVGDALKVLKHYSQLRVGFYRFRTQVQGQTFRVDLEMGVVPELFSRFMIESFLAFVVSQVVRDAMDKIAIEVTYSKPDWFQLYRDRLGVDVRFSQKANSVSFSTALLKRKIAKTNPALGKLALLQCQQQLEQHSQDYKFKVTQIVRAGGNKILSREFVASQLHISGSTLNRRLAEEGTNFTSLTKEIRFLQACEYLEQTDKSVKEIAALLGYEDASNFGRVFREKTGCSASQYRKRLRLNAVKDGSLF